MKFTFVEKPVKGKYLTLKDVLAKPGLYQAVRDTLERVIYSPGDKQHFIVIGQSNMIAWDILYGEEPSGWEKEDFILSDRSVTISN